MRTKFRARSRVLLRSHVFKLCDRCIFLPDFIWFVIPHLSSRYTDRIYYCCKSLVTFFSLFISLLPGVVAEFICEQAQGYLILSEHDKQDYGINRIMNPHRKSATSIRDTQYVYRDTHIAIRFLTTPPSAQTIFQALLLFRQNRMCNYL